MKNCLLLGVFLLSFTGAAMAQSVTVDVPGGYKVVVVPDSVNVPQAVSVTTVPPCRKQYMWPLRQLRLTVHIHMFATSPA